MVVFGVLIEGVFLICVFTAWRNSKRRKAAKLAAAAAAEAAAAEAAAAEADRKLDSAEAGREGGEDGGDEATVPVVVAEAAPATA